MTVHNNGVTATKAINVIPAAFGIFTTPNNAAAGQALAFNVNADGTTTANSVAQSATSGQDVLINGKGLGAITSDETQSGVTDVPTAAVQVWFGVIPATVVSAERGTNFTATGIDLGSRRKVHSVSEAPVRNLGGLR